VSIACPGHRGHLLLRLARLGLHGAYELFLGAFAAILWIGLGLIVLASWAASLIFALVSLGSYLSKPP
jgi:hypothetical protein